MKRLGLLRHAKSEEDRPTGHDFDRGLSPKGRRAAETMGRYIGKKIDAFDKILASPAVRVQETLNIALDAMGRAAPVDRTETRSLYLATHDSIEDVLEKMGGDADSILLVAHNPGLEDFVLDHVPNDGSCALRDIVATKYPTGAFALLELDIDNWADVSDAKAKLITLTRPRDLDPTLGPEMAN
ncbi:SixA phosphatase family protein [Croceicoccus naphthovorans]|uniref:Uncharacterized protein n=1 Tax=Croceicoccus naphthovorans TaxID=1348774 RepID=A0A0G3XHP1_9SPHN|nr:histidine phosphatase family protein [Croceicoccus naphthovorans]AKM10119.1 hypothetical protein AB433_09260 [Croceicoccus naphthovorans]MBB3991594.1 phosphohistidine phosphatase [Croceicoccus naphthovorans]